MTRDRLYWEFVQSEASLVDTDGCSAVLGFNVDCCYEHDLGYRYAKDPRDAYRRYREGSDACWLHAVPITRREVDRRFRKCHQSRSKFGRYSPMAIWRWLGVRIGGRGAWNEHRANEQAERATV